MIALDEVLARITGQSPQQQQAIAQEALSATKSMKWIPNPGPQTDAYFSKADVLLFGGEPGGGKSQLALGLAFNCHERTLIMRRQYGDLDRIVEDALKIHGSRDGFNGSPPPKLKITDRQIIDFAAAHRVGDEQGQMGKGRDLICVEKGTLVLMADETYRPIETLNVGDSVMTLEGKKLIAKVLPIRRALGVRISQRGFSQVQSRTHSLLTSEGWASYDTLNEFPPSYSSSPKQPHDFCRISPQYVRISLRFALSHALKGLDRLLSLGQRQLIQCLQGLRGISACTLQPGRGSACVTSYASTLTQWRHSLLNCSVEHAQPPISTVDQKYSNHLKFSRGACDGPSLTSPQDLTRNCLSGSDPCGELPRLLIHLCSALGDGPECPHQQDDAAQQSPNGFAKHVLGKIPKYTSRREWYSHPYTKEKRRIEGHVFDSAFSMSPVGEVDLHDLEVEGSNHYITYGGFINKNCFDEATHFAESQIRFLMGWLRTDTPGQRTRVIMATNPPLSAEGLWVIEMFAPWLNPQYPNPAKPGELRWVISDIDGKDQWVDGPEPVLVGEKLMKPTSRTYIPSKVSDNPYYAATDYERQLDAMPEPYRSLLMGGFKTAFRDAPDQMIPTKWVQLAQQRWTAKPPEDVPMCAMGVDASGGGDDPMIIASRFDGWFAPLVEVPGKEIPMERAGAHCGGVVLSHRRDMALVVVDMGGGYGGPMYEHLSNNSVALRAYKGAESSARRSSDGKLHFTNKRTAAYWQFREALDPGQPGGSPIALPDDPKLLADLTAPTFEVTPNGIKAEPKDKVCERLGRSTDRGDAVVMAWYEGPRALTNAMDWIDAKERNVKRGRIPQVDNGGRRQLLSVRVKNG